MASSEVNLNPPYLDKAGYASYRTTEEIHNSMFEGFYQSSRGRSQSVKQWLMDNKTVVGVGNIYASESLFKAGINPKTAG